MDRFELAARGVTDGLWDWDLTTNRIHYSNRWNSIMGNDDPIQGNSPEEWFKRIHPEDLEEVQSKIKSFLENGFNQFTIQHRMLQKDNSHKWMSCHGVITRDKDGKAIRIAGSHSEVTGEKVVDDLTGLPNRTLLMDRLTRSIDINKKNSSNLFAVLILDLDLPESVINSFGSAARNLLLVAVARRLETYLRTSDTISRPGFDHLVSRSNSGEFIILIDKLNEVSESKIIAERLLKEISIPFEVNRREVFLSASIGIALSATGYKNPQEVLRDADIALFRAKSLGNGRCEVFDTAVIEKVRAGLELEDDLQQALERQEFSVLYQPIVSLSSNKIAGFEALVRWKHPVRGTISPEDFIPAAEKSGLIIPLGCLVIGEVCKQITVWKENPDVHDDLWISVNLSSVQFKNPTLIKDICKILLDVGNDATSLVLELTEGEVMENPEAANRVLMQLRVTGARIALDDFGTGYSSLAHLCRFPLDYLKIDKSFVKNLETSKDALEIIRAINSLAHQLGLRVIAEGIENQRQLDIIRSLDCEYGQGFLFSKAVGKEQVESLLKKEFKWFVADSKPAMTPDEDATKYIPAAEFPVSLPENAEFDEQRIHIKYKILKKYRPLILVASASVILLLTIGLLDSSKSSTPISAVESIDMTLPAEIVPDPQPEPQKTAKKTSNVREFEVVHNHFLGSCKGTLKVTRDRLSYASDKEECCFDLGFKEMDPSLDKDRLEIKTESKNYHFKSNNFPTKEENQSQIEKIYKYILESKSSG